MGLISKIKAAGATALGALKAKVAPIVGRIRNTPIAGKIIGGAKKIISNPIAKKAVSAGITGAKFGIKRAGAIGLGITAAGLAYTGIKKLTKKKKSAAAQSGIQAGTASAIKTAYTTPSNKLFTPSNIVKGIGIATATGVAAYGAYKLYKAVTKKRKKKSKKKAKTRRRTRRRSRTRSSGRRVTFTTKSGKRVSFIPKSRSRVSFSGRRKRKGYGAGLSKTEIQGIRRLIRTGERD